MTEAVAAKHLQQKLRLVTKALGVYEARAAMWRSHADRMTRAYSKLQRENEDLRKALAVEEED